MNEQTLRVVRQSVGGSHATRIVLVGALGWNGIWCVVIVDPLTFMPIVIFNDLIFQVKMALNDRVSLSLLVFFFS
jgi:hypothetical protein